MIIKIGGLLHKLADLFVFCCVFFLLLQPGYCTIFVKAVAFFVNRSYTQVKKPMEEITMDNKKLNEQELEQVNGGTAIPDQGRQVLHDDGYGGICGKNDGIIIDNSYISPNSTYGAGIGGGAGYTSTNLPGTHDSGTFDS